MLSISEEADRASLFQPHNEKKSSPQANFRFFLQPTFLSVPPSFHLFLLMISYLLFLPLSFYPDAAEESKAEEATPADAAAEATESNEE